MKTHFLLTHNVLSAQALQDFLQDDEAGAQVVFIGTVRNHSSGRRVVALEFEAYEPMAISELEKIAEEIKTRWPVNKIALHHSLGRRAVGEIPVIAGISSAHRKEAFEACEYLMNRLKQTVPIWKKEIFENGEEWVSSTP